MQALGLHQVTAEACESLLGMQLLGLESECRWWLAWLLTLLHDMKVQPGPRACSW